MTVVTRTILIAIVWFSVLPATADPQAPLVAAPLGQEKLGRPVAEPYRGDPGIFDDPKRDRELEINQTMDRLGIGPGAVVADIGAGSGYFTLHAARRVGESGVVYAVDIQQKMLDYLSARAGREKLMNIRPVLGAEDDPRLPAGEVDAALILKTYHEVSAPVELLRRLRAALKPEGRLGVIDQDKPILRESARRVLDGRKKPAGSGVTEEHMIAREFVIAEAARAGFDLVATRELPGEQNYFLIFTPKREP